MFILNWMEKKKDELEGLKVGVYNMLKYMAIGS